MARHLSWDEVIFSNKIDYVFGAYNSETILKKHMVYFKNSVHDRSEILKTLQLFPHFWENTLPSQSVNHLNVDVPYEEWCINYVGCPLVALYCTG